MKTNTLGWLYCCWILKLLVTHWLNASMVLSILSPDPGNQQQSRKRLTSDHLSLWAFCVYKLLTKWTCANIQYECSLNKWMLSSSLVLSLGTVYTVLYAFMRKSKSISLWFSQLHSEISVHLAFVPLNPGVLSSVTTHWLKNEIC